jgi:hypothetical protein
MLLLNIILILIDDLKLKGPKNVLQKIFSNNIG